MSDLIRKITYDDRFIYCGGSLLCKRKDFKSFIDECQTAESAMNLTVTVHIPSKNPVDIFVEANNALKEFAISVSTLMKEDNCATCTNLSERKK